VKLFLSTIKASHRKRGPEMLRAMIYMGLQRVLVRAGSLRVWRKTARRRAYCLAFLEKIDKISSRGAARGIEPGVVPDSRD
jgi:hypothetical protein